MTWWPPSLAWRVTLALAVAGGGVAVLAVSVAEADAAAKTEPPPRSAPLARPTGLGFVLAPVRGSVLLAAGSSAIAPQTAPVIQVLADGSLALRRPAPLASVPGGVVAPGDAAIVLPGRSLRGLDPAVRAALLDVIGQLVDVRPVPPGRIRAVDVECRPAELAALLQWVR